MMLAVLFGHVKIQIEILLNWVLPLQRLEVQFQIQILVHGELDAVHVRGHLEFEIDALLVVPPVTHNG